MKFLEILAGAGERSETWDAKSAWLVVRVEQSILGVLAPHIPFFLSEALSLFNTDGLDPQRASAIRIPLLLRLC